MNSQRFLFIVAISYCILSNLAFASNYREGKVYRTYLSEPKQAIEQREIIVKSLKRKHKSKNATVNNSLLTKKKNEEKSNQKMKNLRRRSKINHTSSTSLRSTKSRFKIKSKINRFEDKNGDGVNDIVKNPKL